MTTTGDRARVGCRWVGGGSDRVSVAGPGEEQAKPQQEWVSDRVEVLEWSIPKKQLHCTQYSTLYTHTRNQTKKPTTEEYRYLRCRIDGSSDRRRRKYSGEGVSKYVDVVEG
jgi:hypothetical protein